MRNPGYTCTVSLQVHMGFSPENTKCGGGGSGPVWRNNYNLVILKIDISGSHYERILLV